MATDTSLALVYTDPNGDTGTKTITYVNPQAAPSDLVTFSQKALALTQNTFVSLTKIDKTVIG